MNIAFFAFTIRDTQRREHTYEAGLASPAPLDDPALHDFLHERLHAFVLDVIASDPDNPMRLGAVIRTTPDRDNRYN